MTRSDVSAAPRRRYVDVAYGILASINAGEFPPGMRLPGDRDMAVAKGTSRQTVREALLVLELIGAVTIRHGDGVYVSDPAAPTLDADNALLYGDPIEVIETRRLWEPITTRLAAERITDEQMSVLEELVTGTHDEDGPTRADIAPGLQFHAELAKCSGNAMMGSVVEQLVNIERHPLWRLVNEQALRVPGARRSQRAEHREILAAVAQHDADRAEAAMREHLAQLQAYIFAPSESSARLGDLDKPRAGARRR